MRVYDGEGAIDRVRQTTDQSPQQRCFTGSGITGNDDKRVAALDFAPERAKYFFIGCIAIKKLRTGSNVERRLFKTEMLAVHTSYGLNYCRANAPVKLAKSKPMQQSSSIRPLSSLPSNRQHTYHSFSPLPTSANKRKASDRLRAVCGKESHSLAGLAVIAAVRIKHRRKLLVN